MHCWVYQGHTFFRKLRAASAKNNYKKESQLFMEIHGKACWKEVKLKSNYAEHHETSDTYNSGQTWMKSWTNILIYR